MWYVIKSSGLVTTMTTASGACSLIPDPTRHNVGVLTDEVFPSHAGLARKISDDHDFSTTDVS